MRYPTLQQYRRAIERALDVDNSRRNAAELFGYLRHFEILSPHIRGLINVRASGLVALDWSIVTRDGVIDERSRQLSRLLQSSIDTLLRYAHRVDLYGVVGFRVVWTTTPDGWQPTIIALRPGAVEIAADGEIIDATTRRRIDPLDPTMLTCADTAGINGGTMISIGYLEIIRNDMILEWANYNRKLKGLIHGIDRGASEQERAAAEAALEQAIRHNYLLTSDLIEIKLEQLASSQGASSYGELLNYLVRMIAIAICGQANLSDLPASSGSRAALQVQRSVTGDIIINDSVYARTLINQLIGHVERYNYGTAGNYHIELDYNSLETDPETASIVIRNALQSGIPLRRDEVYRKIGFTVPFDDNVIMLPV